MGCQLFLFLLPTDGAQHLQFSFLLRGFLGALGSFLLFLLLPGVDFGSGVNFELFLLVGGFAAVVIFNGSLVISGVVPVGFLRRGPNAVLMIADIYVVSLVLVTPIDELFI